MIDHVSIPVTDFDRAAAFYDAVLATVGLARRKARPGAIGYGDALRPAPYFWILARSGTSAVSPGVGLHLSFAAPTRAAVDAFHATALRHGGSNAGEPGLRPEYTQPFYGAFVLDPDGFKIEAVCRGEEPALRAPGSGVIHGIDGCRGGWLSAALDRATGEIRVAVHRRLEPLLAGAAVVAIDVPIGLVDAGARRCDEEARRLLGRGRASSVFPAPLRCVLESSTYPEACAASRAAHGKALSKQTWQIVEKIREVDDLLRERSGLREKVREVHPEVCFHRLAGGRPMAHPKRTLAGRAERLALLRVEFGAAIGHAVSTPRGGSATDDVIDAFAALWTARRIADGTARSIPAEPPRDRFGLRMEMVV